MQIAEYETMYHREQDYWWYLGLHDLVLMHLAGFARARKPLVLLDAGCGTGGLLDKCRRYQAYGLELAPEALPFLRRRSLPRVVRASICRIPFADASFDVVVSMDVLYHVAALGDLHGLREMSRVLRPGGGLLLNLPAYEFLRSHHDVAIHTRQRYTRRQVRDLLRLAGLQPKILTYRNTLLFPVAAGVRLTQKLFRPPAAVQSDLRPLRRGLNRALTLPLWLENRLIRCGLRLPFGLSVYCIATKPT
jgi:SAM-dependent methyltransferase